MLKQLKSKTPLKTLQLGVEYYPFVKTGGMAHVITDLAKNLTLKGNDITVIMPMFGSFRKKVNNLEVVFKDFPIELDKNYTETFTCQTFSIPIDGKGRIKFYLVNHYNFFGRYSKNYYSDKDIHKRFYFFAKAAIEIIKHESLSFDIIHLHDWMVGLFPQLYKTYLAENKIPKSKHSKMLFTIHNLAYQGSNHANLNRFNLPEKVTKTLPGYFNDRAWDKVNFLRHGISYSDMTSTVSANYAKEILTKDFGEGMQNFLKKRKIYGITNGIDYDLNDPQTAKYVYYKFNSLNFKKRKMLNKEKLFKNLFLPEKYLKYPLVFTNHRLAYQKGFNLIIESFKELMNQNIILVILGDGDKSYVKQIKELQDKYRDRFRFITPFSEVYEYRLFAAGDIILSPSVYEPCGISHLRAMRFGVVPVARKVGGLVDTISNYDPKSSSGTGFLFAENSKKEMMKSIKKALNVYQNGDWSTLSRRVMSQSFSWEQRTDEYLSLYLSLIKGKNL